MSQFGDAFLNTPLYLPTWLVGREKVTVLSSALCDGVLIWLYIVNALGWVLVWWERVQCAMGCKVGAVSTLGSGVPTLGSGVCVCPVM